MGMSNTRQADCSPDPHTDAQQGRYGGYLQGLESGRGDEGGLMYRVHIGSARGGRLSGQDIPDCVI